MKELQVLWDQQVWGAINVPDATEVDNLARVKVWRPHNTRVAMAVPIHIQPVEQTTHMGRHGLQSYTTQ